MNNIIVTNDDGSTLDIVANNDGSTPIANNYFYLVLLLEIGFN
jgi:hypothetical protein